MECQRSKLFSDKELSMVLCVTFTCLLEFYNVIDKISFGIRPQLIMNAEKELGIVAALQDRVAQEIASSDTLSLIYLL